jgi:hypothetical protein
MDGWRHSGHRRSVTRTISRRRRVIGRQPIAVGLTAASVLVAACTVASPVGRSPSPAAGAAASTLQAEDAGIALEVIPSAPVLPPGGSIRIRGIVTNDRPTPIRYMSGCEGPIRMSGWLPVPLEPEGRAWDGIGGEFKTYTLEHGYAAGGKAGGPIEVTAAGGACRDLPSEGVLAPGGRIEEVLEWSAELVPGVPALPGEVRIKVSFASDPIDLGRPSPPMPGGSAIAPAGLVLAYKELAVEGMLTIAAPAPRLVTAGEAIDVVLTDARFRDWLVRFPSATWSNANLYLHRGGGGGIVPQGPSWAVELFREVGVPRNWAIGYVDPFTGSLLGLHFCDIPCDR